MNANEVQYWPKSNPMCYNFTANCQNCGFIDTIVQVGFQRMNANEVQYWPKMNPMCYNFTANGQNWGLIDKAAQGGFQ